MRPLTALVRVNPPTRRSCPANRQSAPTLTYICISENTLTYAKEPCAPADTEATFFLHQIPADVADLSGYCRQYGFDNLDFDFDEHGMIFDGRCIVTMALPDDIIRGLGSVLVSTCQ